MYRKMLLTCFLAFIMTSACVPPPPGATTAPIDHAPALFHVRLDTSKGVIVIEMHRDWAPIGVERFYQLVKSGYYDQNKVFRIRAGNWAQFGINPDPKVSQAWRTRNIPDEPRVQSNIRGTIAFAFALKDARTTQVFINLKDNSSTHDAPTDGLPFVPLGIVTQGMEVADAWYSGYGENAGGGIRGGQQAPLFEQGNVYLEKNYPLLDFIRAATIEK